MTIETAIPSSAEAVAALFDTLVEHVAARVLARVEDRITARLEMFSEHEVDGLADVVAERVSAKLDEKIETALALFSENQFDDMVDLWASNFLQDRVSEHVTLDGSMLDIHDEVLEIVQDMSFDIRVSR